VNAAAPISLADLARDARQGARVVWLDQAAYAWRLFCPGEDIWSDARRYVAMARQAQALLGSDVLEWRLGDAQRAAVRANPALIPPLVGRRVGFALRKLIAEAPLIERTTAVLTALQSLFPAVPRVLVVESVESQLTWLAGLTTAEAETAVDASDVDDAAVHLAGAVRGFSAAGLSGLVLDLTGPGAFPTDQILELHRPLLNVARHYDWSLGVLVDARRLPEITKTTANVDFLLCAEAQPGLAGPEGDALIGGGLPPAFWHDEDADNPCPGLCFGTVEADATPELVLARLQLLRSNSSLPRTELKGS